MATLTSYKAPAIPIHEIEARRAVAATLPAGFLKSVRSLGVLEPLKLLDKAPGQTRYEIAPGGGAKRLKAALELGLTSVQGLIYPRDEETDSLHALHESEHRSTSITLAYEIISKWCERGLTEDEVAEKMCVSIQRVRYILNLDQLSLALLNALKDGKIKEIAAIKASKLTQDEQFTLAQLLMTQGKIRNDDVANIRRVKHQDLADELPAELFEPIGGVTPMPPPAIEQAKLTQAIQEVLADKPRYKKAMNALLEKLNL